MSEHCSFHNYVRGAKFTPSFLPQHKSVVKNTYSLNAHTMVISLLNHLHTDLVRSLSRAVFSIYFPWHILNLNVWLGIAFPSTPEEQEHQTEQHHSQERDKPHGGSDYESLHIKGKGIRRTSSIGTVIIGLVRNEGKGLIRLMGPIGRVAMNM